MKGARVDKSGDLWGLCDWRSFLKAVVLHKIVEIEQKVQNHNLQL